MRKTKNRKTKNRRRDLDDHKYPMFPFTDEKAAASGGLFQFMRKTKNMRSQAGGGGDIS